LPFSPLDMANQLNWCGQGKEKKENSNRKR